MRTRRTDWRTSPVRAEVELFPGTNDRLVDDHTTLPGPFGRTGLDAAAGRYAEFFDYGSGAGGNTAALMEGLLRLETCSAQVSARIADLWRDMAKTAMTFFEDANKQRVDQLFGLDGAAGLLGQLGHYRRIAATTLPEMSGAARAEFLVELVSFADGLLPGRASVNLWAWRPASGPEEPSAAVALPVYLQALALIVLVRGWIGGLPGAQERAALMQHRAFLTGDEADATLTLRDLADTAGTAAEAVAAAARALAD